MNDLPFRIDTLDGCSYLVDDAGDRSKPLTRCPNRVATPAEVALWKALVSASERSVSADKASKRPRG